MQLSKLESTKFLHGFCSRKRETETWTKTQTIKMAAPPEEFKTKTETETLPHFKMQIQEENQNSTTIKIARNSCDIQLLLVGVLLCISGNFKIL